MPEQAGLLIKNFSFIYMKTFCTLICLAFITFASPAFSKNQADGPEVQMDQLMTDYVKLLKSTFAEKDDSKSVSMLKSAAPGLRLRFDKLKPELEKWIKSMTDEQQDQFKARLQTKPYIINIFLLMNDESIANRVEKNPELQKALGELGETLGSTEMYEGLFK
jgi:hypothetical protein